MSNLQTSQTETVQNEASSEQYHPMIGFFAIGLAINLLLIAAFVVWAFKQSKKRRRDPNDS